MFHSFVPLCLARACSTVNVVNSFFGSRSQQKGSHTFNFRITGAHDTVLDYGDSFSITLRGDNVQEFDTRWDENLLSMTKIPSGDVLESMRIRGSDQLKTVLELYDMEIKQQISMPKYQEIQNDGEG